MRGSAMWRTRIVDESGVRKRSWRDRITSLLGIHHSILPQERIQRGFAAVERSPLVSWGQDFDPRLIHAFEKLPRRVACCLVGDRRGLGRRLDGSSVSLRQPDGAAVFRNN